MRIKTMVFQVGIWYWNFIFVYFISNQVWNRCCWVRFCKRSWKICICNSIIPNGCSYWVHVSWKVISLISICCHSTKINLCHPNFMLTCSSCFFLFMPTVSLISSCLNFKYICLRFIFDSNVNLCFSICTDAIWATLEASQLRTCCWERNTFRFWCGGETTFPVFDVLMLVLFVSSSSCSSSDSDGASVLLNFFF